jgi:hypothetical protein
MAATGTKAAGFEFFLNLRGGQSKRFGKAKKGKIFKPHKGKYTVVFRSKVNIIANCVQKIIDFLQAQRTHALA